MKVWRFGEVVSLQLINYGYEIAALCPASAHMDPAIVCHRQNMSLPDQTSGGRYTTVGIHSGGIPFGTVEVAGAGESYFLHLLREKFRVENTQQQSKGSKAVVLNHIRLEALFVRCKAPLRK